MQRQSTEGTRAATATVSSSRTGGNVLRRVLLTLTATSLFLASPAIAAWTTAGIGPAGSRAVGVGDVAAPSATLAGTTVDLTWAAATLSSGEEVTGYIITRYDSSGTKQVIATGSCATIVSATSCSETNTPSGTWNYSITPTHAGWKGIESAKTRVDVGVPTLTLSETATKSGTSLNGSIESFTGGSVVRFRLDSSTGPELTGRVEGVATPALVPLSGRASVTVDIPSGTSEGSHTIHAVVDVIGQSASANVTIDDTAPSAPTLTSSPADSTTATSAEFQFTSSDDGVSFQCRLDSSSYAACSSPTSHSGLGDGTHTFDVRAVDAVGNYSRATSFSWTIDTSAPSVSVDFPAANFAHNGSSYNDGCGTSAGDICGTAGSDAGDVRLSIRKGGGNYWDGTGFSSATEVLFTATGTTNWTYAFAAADFPSDDDYTLRAVARDVAGNSRSASTTFSIDRTAPVGADVQSANSSGGSLGTAESGDTITFTYSERVDPNSVLAGWDGSPTNVVVRINDRRTLLLPETDILEVWNASNSDRLSLGAVDLGATDYVSANVTFGAADTPATMVQSGTSIVVTLGTPNDRSAVTSALLPASMTWTPAANARDLAGNNSLTTSATESGTSDVEF